MTHLQKEIQKILNREDVEGLLALGAPENEYDPEAKLITNAIEAGEVQLREEDLNMFLQQVWGQKFGPYSPGEMQSRHEVLRRIAREICAACVGH